MAAVLPVRPVITSTFVIALIADRHRSIDLPGLYIHRCRLHINARHLHAYRKVHIAMGLCRRSCCESAQGERDGGEAWGRHKTFHKKLLGLVWRASCASVSEHTLNRFKKGLSNLVFKCPGAHPD